MFTYPGVGKSSLYSPLVSEFSDRAKEFLDNLRKLQTTGIYEKNLFFTS